MCFYTIIIQFLFPKNRNNRLVYKNSVGAKYYSTIHQNLQGRVFMKATGIVRRIDDLGRIVIPKEIRRSFRIKEGDPLEIFTDAEREVIFKK